MFSILKCFFAVIDATKILIARYISCAVFFRLSFNGKNIHVNKMNTFEIVATEI